MKSKKRPDPGSECVDPGFKRFVAQRALERDVGALLFGAQQALRPVPGDANARLRRGVAAGVLRPDVSPELAAALDLFQPEHLWRHLERLDEPAPRYRVTRQQRRRAEVAAAAFRALNELWPADPTTADDLDPEDVEDLRARFRVRDLLEGEILPVQRADLEGEAIRQAGHGGGAGRGPLTEAARLRRFVADVCRPLRDHDRQRWTWNQLANLALKSRGDWTEEPCNAFLREFEGRDLARELRRQQGGLKGKG